MKTIVKMTARTVRTHFARFVAIFLIVALSAGLFAGLKVTTDAMLTTGEHYLNRQNFYDFRLFSTVGFDKDSLSRFEELEGVKTAEGTWNVDALMHFEGKVSPFKLHAITEKINLVSLEAGRMPEKANECLADVDQYTENDIGKTFTLAEENKDDTKFRLSETEFTVVGLCNSPLYLGIDRGTTNIGSGAVSTFLYIPAEAFSGDIFTEINLTLTETAEIYSDEYDALIEEREKEITELSETLVQERFEGLLAQHRLTPEMAEAIGWEKLGIEEPAAYVLTRNENAGYVNFENDTAIIGSVGNIFPVFFIAIAVLVCITTMTRMVDEERTQIGTLKAMGFGKGAIMAKYLLYAALATAAGWVAGFFLCSWGLPKVFWIAYNIIYNFAPIEFLFSSKLALVTVAISFVSILGTTWLSCRRELSDVPASLIRPRAGKAGKRVLLERIGPLWRRLSFLKKITVRNMLLYKQRMIMMLLGIGCCAGLLVTGFGIRDSMIDVARIQFNRIQTYELEAGWDEDVDSSQQKQLEDIAGIDGYLDVRVDNVDVTAGTTMSGVRLVSYNDAEKMPDYWNLQNDGEQIPLPQKGEVLISPKIVEKLSVAQGDMLELRNGDMRSGRVQVSGLFNNHLGDYLIATQETWQEIFGDWSSNTLLIKTSADNEEIAKQLTKKTGITGVSQLSTTEENLSEALNCLNYIIMLVVAFSAALAFIVIFNLTNINIAERRREIATVQVLGFYPRETESYVLRENLILSVVASLLGMLLGKLFHLIVMRMVRIDNVLFNTVITPQTYLIAFVGAVFFAVIVNALMKRQISKVNMAESLKAVE